MDGEELITSKPGDALEFAGRAAGQYRQIVAVGGDGTVFEVISGLLASGESSSALGIVPLGTGNDSADGLGLFSPEEAIQALALHSRHTMDTISITCQNGGTTVRRHALLFAAVGIVGPLLRFTTPVAKRMLGRAIAYRFAALRALLSYRAPNMRVQCDDGAFEEPFLYIGGHNTETFGGGMRVAPGARPDDGLMNLNLISAVGRLQALRQFHRLCQGTHTQHPRVRYTTGRTLAIQTARPADVAADGDLIGVTPASFSVVPQSLTVLTLNSGK